jgi:lysophospholipase L1-like esterase
MKALLASVVALTALAALEIASASAAEPGAKTKAAPAPQKDDPNLPRVLIVGDSISIGYTDDVRKLLAGKANVHRIPGNAGPSSNGVMKVDAWIDPANGTWDVVHFNFGLHDIKRGSGGKDGKPYPTSDGHQVPPEEYEKNLRRIVERLKTTGATLVWCMTTPVPEGKTDPPRLPADVTQYNGIARKVMEENGVAIDDLHAIALPRLAEIQLKQNVHFTPEGSAELAKTVAASLETALKTRPH